MVSPKFSMGVVVATPGALRALEESGDAVLDLLFRRVSGDPIRVSFNASSTSRPRRFARERSSSSVDFCGTGRSSVKSKPVDCATFGSGACRPS